MGHKSVDTRNIAAAATSDEQRLVLPLPAKDFQARKIAAIKENAIEGYNLRNSLEERLQRAGHVQALATVLVPLIENFERQIPSLVANLESLERTRNTISGSLKSLSTSHNSLTLPVTPDSPLGRAQRLITNLKASINDRLQPLPGIMTKISALRAPTLFKGLYEQEVLRQMAELSDKFRKELPLQHSDAAWLPTADTKRGFDELKRSLSDIITNNRAGLIKTRHSEGATLSATKAQREYSESTESRALKLLSLVQAREHTSDQCSHDEKKIAKRLGHIGCHEILRLLKDIGPGLLISSQDEEAIRAVFKATLLDQVVGEQQPPERGVSQPNQVETSVAPRFESDRTLPPSPEDLEFMRSYLTDLGVKDTSVIDRTIQHLSLEGLTDLVECFEGIPLDVTQAILGVNPRLIDCQSRSSLPRFTDDLRRLLQDGRVNRDHYPVFAPLSNPEFFCNPEALKRTTAAYHLVVGAMIEADRIRNRKE